MLSSKEILWTPCIGQNSVAVALSPEFAKACHNHALDNEAARKIAERVWKNMGNKSSMTPSNFLDFQGSLLLEGVYYKPGDGVWLTLDKATLSRTPWPVMYHDHNADRHASDRLWLLHAFGEWVSAAVILLNWNWK